MNDRLFEIKVKLTSACDYRCQMCGHWREPVTRLTTGDAIEIVRDAAALGARSIIFSGGEPTLHKGLVDAVREAARLGLRVTLATNGGGLAAGKLEALVEAGVAQFNVSIDSPHAAAHDAIRGVPGSFERILEGAARAAKLERPIAVKMVVTRASVESLREAATLADRAPIASLSLTLVTANEPAMVGLVPDLAKLRTYFFDVLPVILEDADARRLPVKLFPIFRRLVGEKGRALAATLRSLAASEAERGLPPDIEKELEAFSRGRYGHSFAGRDACPVLRGKALVRPDGGVFFCCEVSHTGDLRMGDVRVSRAGPLPIIDAAQRAPFGLAHAWTREEYVRLRRDSPRPVHEKCWSCTEWFSRPPEVLLKAPKAARASVAPAPISGART
jgi:MoaA/NifB/PqqE/SkfB family radical SAM enzyme